MTTALLRKILSRRMLAVLLLGFSSGLPLLLIGATLKAWLHDEGVDLTVIGLFGLVGLPYTLKFVWAPFMDRFVPPFLDRRRGWMVICQIALMITLVAMAFFHPAGHTFLFAGLTVLTAFFSASQDIAIDAYRRDVLSDEELGFGFSLAITGYRMGMLVASAGALPFADQLGWKATYLIMAAAMSIGLLTAVWAPHVEAIQAPRTLTDAVIQPFLQFFKRTGAIYILLFILLYKIGDQMATDLVNPFYLELGFTKTEIGFVGKIFGFGAMIAGGLLGGMILFRWSIYKGLWVFGIFQAFSTLAFSILAHSGYSVFLLVIVVVLENLTGGMGSAALGALMASLCDKRFTATQYALFSSLFGITRVIFTAEDGFLAKYLGWESYFVLCALLAIPGLIILSILRHHWIQFDDDARSTTQTGSPVT